MNPWQQKTERVTGNKEDAKALNLFLNSLELKINNRRDEFSERRETVSSIKLINYVLGKTTLKSKVMQEFQLHNDQMFALVEKKEYAIGTHERYRISKNHVREFMLYKYGVEDMEFNELNFEFVKDYEFYLKTVKIISNNTALKYITNFKKIVLSAVDKEIIAADPFKRFKSKKNKVPKKTFDQSRISIAVC